MEAYRAMEFAGPVIEEMSISSRMALCNLAVELGAKNGIVNPDDKVCRYLKDRTLSLTIL